MVGHASVVRCLIDHLADMNIADPVTKTKRPLDWGGHFRGGKSAKRGSGDPICRPSFPKLTGVGVVFRVGVIDFASRLPPRQFEAESIWAPPSVIGFLVVLM